MFEVAGRERSTRRICFYRLSCMLLVWHKLIWEKAITRKRMAILMKETKIKKSSLSLTLEPGNKILIRSIIFFIIRENKNSKKKDGRDLITTSTLMTAVTNTWSFQCRKLNMPTNDFHSRKCLFNSFTWLFFG